MIHLDKEKQEKTMKILETDRLLLRHLLPSDLDNLYALYSDPEIRRYFPDGTRTYEETREELEWFLNGHPNYPELGSGRPSTRTRTSSLAGVGCFLGSSTGFLRLKLPICWRSHTGTRDLGLKSPRRWFDMASKNCT